MLRALTKTVMFALLFAALSSTASRAEVKIYQYDGKLPFVQMMLNMMVAMGVLDRIPGHLVYGSGPYGYGNRNRNALSNPYLRAMAMRGYPVSGLTGSSLYGRSLGLNSPGFGSPGFGSPWTSSSWMSSPWTGSGLPYASGFGAPWTGSWLGSDSVWGDSFGWPDRYGYQGGGPYGYGPYGGGDNLDRAVLWNSPTWGVLPVDEFAMGDLPDGSPWKSDDLQAWAKEPWSDVDPADWSQPVPESQYGSQYGSSSGLPSRSPLASLSQAQQAPQQPPQQPIVLNNIITTSPGNDTASGPASVPGGADAQLQPAVPPRASREVQSPLAKLDAPPPAEKRQDIRQAEPSSENSKLQASPLYKYSEQAQKYVLANPRDEQQYQSQLQYKKVMPPSRAKRKQKDEKDDKLCVTEHCGLRKPDINGLWVSQNGEMLGVKSDRYLWTDGVSRYLTGRIKLTNEYLLTNIEGYDTIMRFKYKLANDNLLTMQEDGTIREFVRVTDLDRSRQMYY